MENAVPFYGIYGKMLHLIQIELYTVLDDCRCLCHSLVSGKVCLKFFVDNGSDFVRIILVQGHMGCHVTYFLLGFFGGNKKRTKIIIAELLAYGSIFDYNGKSVIGQCSEIRVLHG